MGRPEAAWAVKGQVVDRWLAGWPMADENRKERVQHVDGQTLIHTVSGDPGPREVLVSERCHLW